MELDVAHPLLLPPGGGEVVGDSAVRRVEILSDDPALHATWSRFGPRRDGADLHVHRRHTDLFYVLAGELTLRLGVEDERVAVPAGTLVRVPPLVAHGFRNGGDAELRYLNFHAPGTGFADYLRGSRAPFDQEDPPAEGVRPATEAAIGGAVVLADRPGLHVARLADVEEVAVAEVRCEPGTAPPPADARQLQCLYVLAGELAVTAGGRELRGGPGTWVQVPAHVPCTVAAAGGEARYLDVRAPGRFPA